MQANRNSQEILSQLLSDNFQARFWRRVDKRGPDECWRWLGHIDTGYGKLAMGGRKNISTWLAHRVAWISHNKQFPPLDKPIILHSCIACGMCCNPSHLRAGTDAENSKDKMDQGRGNQRFGVRVNTCKLTPDKVLEIRTLLNSGQHTQRTLAEMFSVKQAIISQIKRRVSWKQI